MRITAIAPANIAFIKYWGKKDEDLRLPTNDSISVNLSGLLTTTTVEFSNQLSRDEVTINGRKEGKAARRVAKYLDRIRKKARITDKARVVSKTNFPLASGLASSASGFAALAVAASKAAGLDLSEKELAILARLGSGSACRSIPDGFVYWRQGNSSETSYAVSLYPPKYWDLAILAVLIENGDKEVGSTEAMRRAETSHFFETRLKALPDRIRRVKKAFESKDFKALGEIVEAEALELHSIIFTSTPSHIYWLPGTVAVMKKIRKWRSGGLESYFTIDAGANVFVLCQDKNREELLDRIIKVKGVEQVIANRPVKGARLINKHLF